MKFPQPRLLPFAIAFTIAGIGLRTVDMISLAVSGSVFTTVSTAVAETTKSDSPPPAAGPVADPAAPTAKAQVANAEMPGSGLPSHPPVMAPDDAKSATDLLQSLTEKRKQLDEKAQALDQREALLKAAEDRIDKKVDELSGMRSDLEKLLDLQKTKDDAQMASLVKIYENMKSKDAAAIFDALELPVLVDVSARMKESKIAPILAAMDPDRARILTVKLAEHRRVMEGAVADAKAALNDGAPPAPATASPDAAGTAPAPAATPAKP